MDQALKQRLVGALVITALAAIFVPMFFEDSVDESRREVDQSNLTIPAAPEKMFSEDNPIPKNPQPVLHATDEETVAAPEAETSAEDTTTSNEDAAEAVSEEETAQPEQPLTQAEEEAAEEEELQPIAAPAPYATEKPTAEHDVAPLPPQTPQQPVRKAQPPQTATLQPVHEQPPAAQSKPTPAHVAPAAKNQELKRWVVQLGSFSKKANADSLVNKLRSQGFNAYDDTIQVEGKGTMYRVRIGPELDKKRAQATQKKLQQLNATNSMLISE